MKKKRKIKKVLKIFLITIIITIIAFIGIVVLLAIMDLKQESNLEQEIINYNTKDLAKDDFTVKINTKGDYAYVEKAVKEYYKSLSDNVKTINSYLNNEKFSNLLTVNNLESDRPDFTFSHNTIKITKNNINKAIKNIDKLCDEKTIKNLLDKEKLDDADYYYDFYLELMYTKNDKNNFKNLKNRADNLGTQLNSYLDKLDETINFLQKNDKSIKYEQDKQSILFNSQTLYIEWKKQIAELEEIAENMEKVENTENSPNKV